MYVASLCLKGEACLADVFFTCSYARSIWIWLENMLEIGSTIYCLDDCKYVMDDWFNNSIIFVTSLAGNNSNSFASSSLRDFVILTNFYVQIHHPKPRFLKGIL